MMSHTFHIPVLGLGYSVDTPLKVARYGISSVMSIVDDELVERMREFHIENKSEYVPITKKETDYRAKRIKAYLNLVKDEVEKQFNALKNEAFEEGTDIHRYFEMLPSESPLKQEFDLMLASNNDAEKRVMQQALRDKMTIGAIDANIMSKVDKMNYNEEGESTGDENTDAIASLRGFALSDLESSVILSAGMNPRLYSYLETLDQFLPDEQGNFKKKVVLKVSDYRSAFIQAKFLAKKGVWVYEFRVESGLNCGGHAFATDGYLLGPILEEFKQKREEMVAELFQLYQPAVLQRGITLTSAPRQLLTVQGGIGTASENSFLMEHYNLDGTGWGSPFLLVPEVTNVDEHTLKLLAEAEEDDFYISNSSPLGILFNNFRGSSSNQQRLERLQKGKPGSPCTKKYLVTNTEFTEHPICLASREYQNLKINQLNTLDLSEDDYREQFNNITEKICLCEGLCASTYIKDDIIKPKENKAVAICPGPNLAYFRRIYTLDEMVKHIYGKLDLLDKIKRPNMFIKELNLYIDYLQTDMQAHIKDLNEKKRKNLIKFKAQLEEGISYYKQLFEVLPAQASNVIKDYWDDLIASENKLSKMLI
jgi:hypothetical protein